MIALIQRVAAAAVDVGGNRVAEIQHGVLLLLGVERGDDEPRALRLLERVIHYRIFEDSAGKMNLSLIDTGGGLLVAPQFTLAADTAKGLRPSFTPAAPPVEGKKLFDFFVAEANKQVAKVETGIFGADMQISLINDGPATFWLKT